MVAQAGGQRRGLTPKGRLETAALDHVDVGGGQLTVAKIVDAPAAPPTGHAHAFLQVRRQVAFGRGIEALRVLVHQPYPAGVQAKHVSYQAEGPVSF